MSVSIITSAWNIFNKIPKQNFTEVIMQSLAMTKLIKDFNEKDYKRLIWLRDNTHKKINRSIYELDRYVDETKGNVSNKSFTFGDDSFTQDEIQNHLCIATQEVYEIIYKNFKGFKVEEKLDLDEEEQTGDESW